MKTTFTTTSTFQPKQWNKELFTYSDDERSELKEYYYNYSYQYPWVKTQNNTIDEVKVNQNTSLKLTDKHLEIIQRDTRNIIDVQFVKHIGITFKKLFLPITVGGILAPLALVGIHANILKPLNGISIIVVAILLFYYGFQGGYQLEIQMRGFQKNILIDEKSPSIMNFVKKANRFLLKMRR